MRTNAWMGSLRGVGKWALPALWLIVGQPRRADAEFPPRYQLADLKALEQAFVDLAEQVQPSVVAVRTYKAFEPDRTEDSGPLRVKVPLSQGSGFVIDAEGYIATNRHVIEDADAISIRLSDGTAHDARVVEADARSDLAVLKIGVSGLKPVRWGDLSTVRVSQWVFACGNPFGLANDDGRPSVSLGVISALGRHMTERLVGDSEVEYYGNLLETTAAISPGNSGGPLFNIEGEVVGVVTAIESGAGARDNHGFAIPIDKNARRIFAALKAGQPLRYGFLGVQVEEVETQASDRVVSVKALPGARIREIKVPNGPAALAGLKPHDIVIEFDGTSVQSSDHLVRLVGFTPVGTEAVVTFLRNGVKRRTTIVVGDRAELLGLNDSKD